MSFANMKLAYNNALRAAQNGNDGTAYAVCNNAQLDAGDLFKVRGDILPVADIPSITSLVGCQLVSDTTGNPYNIVAAEAAPYSEVYDTLLQNFAENMHGQMVKVGSYVYAVVNKTILQLDTTVSPPTIVSRCLLPYTEQYAFTLICTDNTFLYVGSTLTTTLYIIRISSMEIEWSGVPPSLGGNPSALACDSNYLFVASGNTIGKYTIGLSPQFLASRTGGLNTFRSLYAGATDGHLYAAGTSKSIPAANQFHRIWKISKATMADVASAPDSTGEFPILASSGEQLVVIGTDIYSCFTRAGVGYASKASLTAFPATVTEGATAAGEFPPAGVATDGTNLFLYCNLSPIKIVKMNAALARTGGLTLTAGENGTAGYGNIIYDGAAFYVGCTTSPAILAEVTTAPVRTGILTYSKGLVDAGYGAKVDGNYAYVAFPASPSWIGKFDLSTKQLIATLALNTGENTVNSLVIGSDGLLYAGCGVTPGIVVQIDIATSVTAMTRLGATAAFAAGEGPINALVETGGKVYAGLGSTPAKIKKVNCADLALDAVLTCTAGRNDCRTLNINSTNIYAGCYTNHVVKCDLGAFTETSAVDTGNPVIQTDADDTYLYTIMDAATNNIRRIDFATFTLGTVLSASGGTAPKCCVVHESSLHVFSGTSKFNIVNLTSWAIVVVSTVTTIDTVSQAFKRMLVHDNYVWLVNGAGSSEWKYTALYRVDQHSNFTLFEAFQAQDLGDGFTVRAGLTCAQQSATYPAFLAADTRRSPVHKGTENTAHYLRAHAPNFLEDGGLESGILAPHWTTDGGWTVESASPLEGAYSFAWDLAASKYLRQASTRRLEKGETYYIVYKAGSVAANPTDGSITLAVKQATSGTALDAAPVGAAPSIATAAAWKLFSFVAAFSTNDWTFSATGDHTKANGATKILLDEFYFYSRRELAQLVLDRHNLVGKSSLIVRSYKMSPLRSTVAAADYTDLATFTVTTADNFKQALTSNYDPVVELQIPATAGFTPYAGEIYIGDEYTVPVMPKSFDPYRRNKDKVMEMNLDLRPLDPALRLTVIEDIFQRARDGEPIYTTWNTDPPSLREIVPGDQDAPYDPYMTRLNIKAREVI